MLVCNPTTSSSLANSICSFLAIPNITPTKTRPHLFPYVVNHSSSTLRFKTNLLLSVLSSPFQSRDTHFAFPSVLARKTDIFRVYARKKGKKGGNSALFEMSDDEFEDEDEVDGDDEDGEMIMPFMQMQRWLENKPRGFGEGKVYETSIEDKLLEEIEQSRNAQALNVNNLKNNPDVKPGVKKDDPKKKAAKVVQTGIRVRVLNLPKKKNVHRDLKLAFKDVPGIVNIVPVVSGNKKTRDPICKGFAFIDFKSVEDAARFIRLFSRQSVPFGKVQKQIICEMANPHSSSASDDKSDSNIYSTQQFIIPTVVSNLNDDFDIDDSSLGETASSRYDDPDDDFVEAEFIDLPENIESLSMSESDDYDDEDSGEPRTQLTTRTTSSKKQNKNKVSKKKTIGKGKREKIQKFDIRGSARRLKIKEKAVLTDVFNKYGSQAALASREEKANA